MSNLPTREELKESTETIPPPRQLPREYRVTGTQPTLPVPPSKPKTTTLGIENSTLFWITLGIHGVLIATELYLAHKAGWI